MRSKATTVNNLRTPVQLNQRAKFSTVIHFLRPLNSFMRFGFRSQAVRMSGFNAAMAYNLKNAVSGIYPQYSIDYEKALVSRGPLPGALNANALAGVAGQIDFTWEDNSTATNSLTDDKVVLMVYSPLRNQAVTVIGGSAMQTEAYSITLPDLF